MVLTGNNVPPHKIWSYRVAVVPRVAHRSYRTSKEQENSKKTSFCKKRTARRSVLLLCGNTAEHMRSYRFVLDQVLDHCLRLEFSTTVHDQYPRPLLYDHEGLRPLFFASVYDHDSEQVYDHCSTTSVYDHCSSTSVYGHEGLRP